MMSQYLLHADKAFGTRINGNRDMIRIFFYLCLCLFINFLDGSHQIWKFNKNIHNEHSFFLSPIHTIIQSLSFGYIFSRVHSLSFLHIHFRSDIRLCYLHGRNIASRKHNIRITNFWKTYWYSFRSIFEV